MTERTIFIATEYIKLEQLLKLAGAFPTGGAAKEAILAGKVTVGGEPCRERGRKLRPGDRAQYSGVCYTIAAKTQEGA